MQQSEKDMITSFIDGNNLTLKHLLLTHCHVDHACAARWLANHYGVKKNSGYEQALKYLLELGAVTAAAKAALEALKAVPGLTLGAVTINAIVAGSIVAGLGEGCIGIFELVSKGEISFFGTLFYTQVPEVIVNDVGVVNI